MNNIVAINQTSAEPPSYRILPHNIEAEQVLLGAILTNNESINRIGDFLAVGHFYEPVHQRIYEAIIRLVDRGLIATPITLKNQFDKDEALAEIGGASYLAKLAGQATGIINIIDYAKLIYDLAIRRKLIEIGENVVNNAYDNEVEKTANEQIETAEHELFSLASTGSNSNSFSSLSTSLADTIRRTEFALKNRGGITGVPTNLKDLDKWLGGMHNSDLLILAARPSMGKTALAINIAVNAAEAFIKEAEENKAKNIASPVKSVGFFSLEMSSEQIAARILSMKTKISSTNIRRGKLDQSKNEFDHLVQSSKTLNTLPFFIDDTPALSISALRTRARRLKRKHNLGLLVIDYLQLIRGVSDVGKNNRVQEISEITQGLKAIAKELDIPLLALSQLSRAVEQRDDKRPLLADLRESGTIEQDADVVMFIYREAYYLERTKPQEGTDKFQEWQQKMEKVDHLAEVMIAKHRNGPIANVQLAFDKHITLFSDFVDESHLPEAHF